MSDHQDQELLQQTSEVFIDNRLSLLHLDQETMEATNGADQIPAPDAEQSRSEYGGKTPKKRRSPCSAYAQPLRASDSDAGVGHRQILSEGYRLLPDQSAGKQRTAVASPPNAAPLCRCSSLPSASSFLPRSPAEIQGRSVAALPETRTRRPLFASPASQSLPPLHPLNRTVSDPQPFSLLQNPIVPNMERGSPAPSSAIISGLDPDQEPPSSKRVKRINIQRLRQKVNQLMDEIAIEEGSVDDSTNDSEIAPTGDHKLVNCNGGSEVVVAPELGKEINEAAAEPEVGTMSLETIGDCTHVEFACRCGSGYSLRVIGRDFFYKLSG